MHAYSLDWYVSPLADPAFRHGGGGAYFVSENCTGGSRGPIFVEADLTYPNFSLSLRIYATSFSNSRILVFFYFDLLIYVVFGPMTGPLMRLEPHWRIPRDAPVLHWYCCAAGATFYALKSRNHRNYSYFLGHTPVFLFTKIPIFYMGRSFTKQVVGAEPVKTAQSTIKILEFHTSPRIWHTFSLKLRNLGFSDPSCGGSTQAPTTEYETTPLIGRYVPKCQS